MCALFNDCVLLGITSSFPDYYFQNTAPYMSAYCYILVLMLRILLYMCPHAPHIAICVSSYCNTSFFPDYYLQNFHWQTDGWLSTRSARSYEYTTEVCTRRASSYEYTTEVSVYCASSYEYTTEVSTRSASSYEYTTEVSTRSGSSYEYTTEVSTRSGSSYEYTTEGSAYCCMCQRILLYMSLHTAIYASAYCCTCVLILLYTCVLILLYMSPHTGRRRQRALIRV
jgi:hypothetical protein